MDSPKFNLERDLYKTSWIWEEMETTPELAEELYQALCNNQFRHVRMSEADESWACSWRYAGEIASTLHSPDETYLDYYCSGHEGRVTDRIQELLTRLEWIAIPYDNLCD